MTFMRKVVGRRKKTRNMSRPKRQRGKGLERQRWEQGNGDQHLRDRILTKLPLNIIEEPILNA